MSGIETALGVYGLITGTITIIDTSIQIYDAVKDKSGIPEKLRKVSETLPSLKELLRGAEAQFNQNQLAETAWTSAGKDVQRCNEACRELQDLLSRAYPEEQASRARRFVKATTTILSGKGKTAEQLLKEIQGYLEVLLDRQILTNAALLEDIKATVDEILPRDGQVVQNNVHGDNIGRDKKSYAHSGSGHMFTGDNGTFHIGGLPDDLNEDLRIQRLQDWLGFAQMNNRECDIETAHKATFKWALQPRKDPKTSTTPSPNLAKFLRDRDGLFWIQGKLGSGKSTLMKYMWRSPLLDDYLRAWARGKPLYRAAFFFTKKGTSELQKSLQGLYRTLLAHLIRSDTAMARIAFPHWRLHDASHEPTVAVLRNALLHILEHATLSRKYCFFIDGLDEYEEANPKLQTQLARDILDLTNLPGVKIVAASRPEAPFAGRFHGCPTLHLQDLTQGDIEAYVTAELTRSATCTSRPLTDDQIEHLVDQVVQKAEGVFLWVVLVVTDLVVGIDHAEPYHELDESLNRLDRDLHTLFKQILLERIPSSHRQQVVRHLLISSYIKEFEFGNHGTLHAVGIQVQAGSDWTQPDIYDRDTSCQMTMDLITQLPVRSRGLCSVSDSKLASDVSVTLIHSSMYEFLADPNIRTILQKQAGSNFTPGLTVSIGLMAHLVVALHDNRKDRSGIANTMLDLLSDAVRSIEIDRFTSSVPSLRSMTSLQHLISKQWEIYPFPTLASLTWSRTLPATGSGRPALKLRAGFLEYATYKGYATYLQHQIILNNNTIPATNGCPLLFYAVSWNSLAARLSPPSSSSSSVNSKSPPTTPTLHPQELLLNHGANPNEIYEGRTPWGELLRLFRNYLRDDASYERTKFALDVLSAALDVARCMLLHGADPSLGDAQTAVVHGGADSNPDEDEDEDADVVSTHIFRDLLKETCCTSGGCFADCSCADARVFRPQFMELAELVERKKLEERLGLLVHLGWLGVQMAGLYSVSYYVWAGLVALLAGLLLMLFV